MKNFWAFVSNEKFSVGCTGQTVYVYNHNKELLATFKDIKYAYLPVISPRGDLLAVKSTAGQLAIYSLEKLCLIKKFRFSKIDGGQDSNCCFSPDGNFLYNIEDHTGCGDTCVSVYDTINFSLVKQFLLDDKKTDVYFIEYDIQDKTFYVLGIYRKKSRNDYFVAKLNDGILIDAQSIPENIYDFYESFKTLEIRGFTKKAKEWSHLNYIHYDLTNIENKKFSLSDLLKKYQKN